MLFITFLLFFFTDTATTEIYTLSLHDALPISRERTGEVAVLKTIGFSDRLLFGLVMLEAGVLALTGAFLGLGDRKSTRLNSSHTVISYAVFCLKKKKK